MKRTLTVMLLSCFLVNWFSTPSATSIDDQIPEDNLHEVAIGVSFSPPEDQTPAPIEVDIPKYYKSHPTERINTMDITEEDDNSFYDQVENVSVYLRENGYVKEKIGDDELRSIVKEAIEISDDFSSIPASLTLSLIANESGYDRYDESNAGARGLCQIIPKWHEERLMQYVEDDSEYDSDMFFNTTLSIKTGLDYISYILTETEGDLTFALMWYNQGAASAYDKYVVDGVSSGYAKNVIALSEELEGVLCNNR